MSEDFYCLAFAGEFKNAKYQREVARDEILFYVGKEGILCIFSAVSFRTGFIKQSRSNQDKCRPVLGRGNHKMR